MPITSELKNKKSRKGMPRVKRKIISKIENTTQVTIRLRVAAYCRVSTNSIRQEGSIEAQKLHMRDYINSNSEWELVDVYYEAGVSGTKAESRPELMRLLEDCKTGKIDLVITKSISRFSRNTVDYLDMVRTLTALGVGVFFEKENVNTSSMESEFFLSVLACLAADESQSISQNLKWGYRKRFQEGIFKYKRAPYGYEIQNGELVINNAEAEIVREIFHRITEGDGTLIIAKDMKARGVPTKSGGEWQQVTVREIVRNIIYTGDAIFQKTFRDDKYMVCVNRGELDQYYVENHHEAIVSHEVYEQANATMSTRRKQYSSFKMTEDANNAQKRQQRSVFSSKMICACCGGVLHRNTQIRRAGQGNKPYGNKWVWVCSNHVKDKNLCQMKPVKEIDVVNAFVTMINKLLYSQRAHQSIIDLYDERMSRTRRESGESRIAAMVDSLSEIKKKKAKLIDLSRSAAISPITYNEKMGVLMSQEKQIRAGITRCDDMEIKRRITALKRTILTIPGETLYDFSEDLFESIIEKVIVSSHQSIRFMLKCGMELTEYYPEQ